MKRYIKNVEEHLELEPIVSMARVGLDDSAKMLYYVNPDDRRVGDPYFKVYNNISHRIATEIARISFLEPRYIVHRDEAGKQPWKLNSSEKKKMINFLSKKSGFLNLTFWQYTMYHWDNEYGFLHNQFDTTRYNNILEAYADGFYDTEENLNHPSYLRSDLQMPDYMQL